MKKYLIILLAAVLAIGLAACADDDGSLGEITAVSEEPEVIDVGDEVPGNSIVRTDDDGLVSVRIKDGSAEIYFHLEEWGDLNTGQDTFAEGPFQIVTQSGAAVDAIVGKVESMDVYSPYHIVIPTVAILTEHGKVEYFLADPSIGWQENEYGSSLPLPWIKDIVSFSYEAEPDGRGDMAIYAWDKSGLMYNIRLVSNLLYVFDDRGIWEFFMDDQQGGQTYCGMVLNESGGADILIGGIYPGGGSIETEQTYSGSYNIYLAENGDHEPGFIDFDLSMTWWIAELGDGASAEDAAYWEERTNLVGSYRFSAADGFFNLFLMDGDALMHTGWRGEPIVEYNFWLTMFYD